MEPSRHFGCRMRGSSVGGSTQKLCSLNRFKTKRSIARGSRFNGCRVNGRMLHGSRVSGCRLNGIYFTRSRILVCCLELGCLGLEGLPSMGLG